MFECIAYGDQWSLLNTNYVAADFHFYVNTLFMKVEQKGILLFFNLLGSGTANYSFSSIASSTISDVWKNVDYFGVVYYNSVLDLHYQKPEKKEGAL